MAHLQNNEAANSPDAVHEALRKITHALHEPNSHEQVEVAFGASDDVIRLPNDLAKVLREVLVNAAAGRSVSVIPSQAELTTQQAADILNVSRPHVVKLMNEGTLPGHKTGSHRRIYAADVQAYKHQRDIDARTAADELTALSEETGIY